MNNNLKIIMNKIIKTYNINKKNIIILKIKYFKIIKYFQKFYLYKKKFKNRNNKYYILINKKNKYKYKSFKV